MRTLIAIPVYNEQRHVANVLDRVREFVHPPREDVLVIDDGSRDGTPAVLATFPVEVIRHAENRGYGHSMQSAFRWAAFEGYDWLITMDCDEQHEPDAIPRFLEAAAADDADVISGSRYLAPSATDDSPPPERRAINGEITELLNRDLGLSLTDAFCGFKAYRVDAIRRLSDLAENGYAFPMQFWVRAVAAGLRITEIPVRLIYNDLNRSFGGPLDDRDIRRKHYLDVYHGELAKCRDHLPAPTVEVVGEACRNSG